MEDVVSTFPLLRLPNKAILNTLRIMTHLEIFGISVLSKKTKNLVESLKITTIDFEVEVIAAFDVTLFFPSNMLEFTLYHVRENEQLQDLETSEDVYIIYGNQEVTLSNWRSVKQLLDHLQLIFHSSITFLSFIWNSERFSGESLCRIIKKVESVTIFSENRKNNRKILSSIQAATLDIWNYSDECIVPRNVLIQNLDVILAPKVHITLDELLLTNARGIHMSCRRLSVNVFNKFLKLWTKGSNPRLEWVDLKFQENSQKGELLRGIKYQEASPNTERVFKYCGDRGPNEVVGGWDIRRFDGTKATITVSGSGNSVAFYVWHNHCLLNRTNP